MKKLNRILSCIIALSMLISIFSVISVSASALGELTLAYTFTNEEPGIADGTIKISGIDAELQTAITNVNMYWGKSATEKLEGYKNIKNYTVDGINSTRANYYMTKLEYTDSNELVCEYTGNRYLPEGATHLIAEVVTADETKVLSVAIPEAKYPDFNASNMKYSMWWISDVHADFASVLPNSMLNVSLPYIKDIADADGDKFKGMIVNGDMADFGKKFEYTTLEDAFVKHGLNFPIYYSTGNHDIAMSPDYGIYSLMYADAKDAMDYRFERLEKDFGLTFDRSDMWSYETYIEGEHHIFLAVPYMTESIRTYQLTDAQEKWLEEKICYDEKSGVPTYIYIHVPYTGTVSRSGDTFTDPNFATILSRHPSAVVITSHIHLELNTDMNSVVMGDATSYGVPFIDTSSLKDTYANGTGGKARSSAYGRYVRVYDDKILVRAMYTVDGMWVPRAEYVIPIAGAENPFEGTFAITSSATEGTIEEGTVLTATLNGRDVPEGYTVTWYDMTGVELGTGDTYTVVTANASVSAKIVKTEDSSYAYDVARYIAPVEDDGTAGEGGDTPSVEITGDATVKYYGEVVNISGSAGTDFAGQEATIVLAPKSTYSDLSTAKYVGNCTIDAQGNYSFKFKAGDVSQNDVFMIKVGTNTVSINEVVARTKEEIVEVITTLGEGTNILSLSIKNMLADTTKAKLIIATYDANDTLIKITPVEYSLAFNENLDLQTYAGDTALTGTYVRVYMWTNLSDLVPLSDSDKVEIPKLSTETVEVSE